MKGLNQVPASQSKPLEEGFSAAPQQYGSQNVFLLASMLVSPSEPLSRWKLPS